MTEAATAPAGVAPVRRPRRRRFTPLALAVGLIGSAIVSSGVGTTWSALTAQIRNTGNTAGTGTIYLQETENAADKGDTGCTSFDGPSNALDCTTFNKYGGASLQPGSTSSTTSVRLIDVGSLTATTFTLTPGTCATDTNPLGASGDICSKLSLTVSCTRYVGGTSQGTVAVISGAVLSTIGGTSYDLKTAKNCAPPPGSWGGTTYTRFDFTVSLSSAAGTEVQGETAKQSLRWQMTAGT